MNIGRQWEDRLRIWSGQYEKRFIADSIPLEVSFFTTMEQLPFAQAQEGVFQPAPAGMKWGASGNTAGAAPASPYQPHGTGSGWCFCCPWARKCWCGSTAARPAPSTKSTNTSP